MNRASKTHFFLFLSALSCTSPAFAAGKPTTTFRRATYTLGQWWKYDGVAVLAGSATALAITLATTDIITNMRKGMTLKEAVNHLFNEDAQTTTRLLGRWTSVLGVAAGVVFSSLKLCGLRSFNGCSNTINELHSYIAKHGHPNKLVREATKDELHALLNDHKPLSDQLSNEGKKAIDWWSLFAPLAAKRKILAGRILLWMAGPTTATEEETEQERKKYIEDIEKSVSCALNQFPIFKKHKDAADKLSEVAEALESSYDKFTSKKEKELVDDKIKQAQSKRPKLTEDALDDLEGKLQEEFDKEYDIDEAVFKHVARSLLKEHDGSLASAKKAAEAATFDELRTKIRTHSGEKFEKEEYIREKLAGIDLSDDEIDQIVKTYENNPLKDLKKLPKSSIETAAQQSMQLSVQPAAQAILEKIQRAQLAPPTDASAPAAPQDTQQLKFEDGTPITVQELGKTVAEQASLKNMHPHRIADQITGDDGYDNITPERALDIVKAWRQKPASSTEKTKSKAPTV